MRKRAAVGDFRVQERVGGTAARDTPPSGVLAQATEIAARLPRPWLYARIDGVERDGDLLLMEVELTEPTLFLGTEPRAASRLADALLAASKPALSWPRPKHGHMLT